MSRVQYPDSRFRLRLGLHDSAVIEAILAIPEYKRSHFVEECIRWRLSLSPDALADALVLRLRKEGLVSGCAAESAESQDSSKTSAQPVLDFLRRFEVF